VVFNVLWELHWLNYYISSRFHFNLSRVAREDLNSLLEKIQAFVCFMLIHFNKFQADICSAFGNQVMAHPDFIETILEILACPMDVVKPLGF
jgi:hypothetical protein